MSTLKDVSIIVKWNGKEYPITDLSDQETVAVLKHEIAKLTNVRPERQKLLNLKHRGLCKYIEPKKKMLCVLLCDTYTKRMRIIVCFVYVQHFHRQNCCRRFTLKCTRLKTEFQTNDGWITRSRHSRCSEFH